MGVRILEFCAIATTGSYARGDTPAADSPEENFPALLCTFGRFVHANLIITGLVRILIIFEKSMGDIPGYPLVLPVFLLLRQRAFLRQENRFR